MREKHNSEELCKEQSDIYNIENDCKASLSGMSNSSACSKTQQPEECALNWEQPIIEEYENRNNKNIDDGESNDYEVQRVDRARNKLFFATLESLRKVSDLAAIFKSFGSMVIHISEGEKDHENTN